MKESADSFPHRGPVVSVVSLGCSKNTVDTERILAILLADGFLLAEDPRDADVCLVNTCGFIGPAREETADTLRELAALKNRAGRPRLVALGCGVEWARKKPEYAEFLEAADAQAGFDVYRRLPSFFRALCAGKPFRAGPRRSGGLDPVFYRGPRLLTGEAHIAPLKISEGCSNGCRFCSIPAIRGPQISRPLEEILSEANDLLASGVREIDLIAQDTTAYGTDLYGRRRLADLLRAITALESTAWFRLLYACPGNLADAVTDVLASDARFCPYLDLPIQHISDRILKSMGRTLGRAETLRLLKRLKKRWPALEMRSSFIVGFPGETEAEFEELRDFAEQGWFLYAGVFAYSPETGTPAARLPNPVPEPVKEARRAELAETLTRATARRLKTYVGRTLPVMIDRRTNPRKTSGVEWVARTRFQAPEVDGVVRLSPRADVQSGRVIKARIRAVDGVDLVAEPLS